MKYPQELIRRADAILSDRRQAAWHELSRRNRQILQKHPDIWEERGRLNELGVQLGRLSLDQSQGLDPNSKLLEEISAAGARISAMLKAAGLPADYLDAPYICQVCEDKGFLDGRMCDCRRRILNSLVYEMLSNTSRASECSFSTFDLTYYTGAEHKVMVKLLEACKRYAAEFTPSSPNLLFTGPTGLGKTHLSLAIAREVVNRGYLVMYASAAQLISRIVDSVMGDAAQDEYRDIVYGCDLLIIDDLGTEIKTHVTKDEVHNLINTRLNEGRPTIINTNLTLRDIEDTYGQRVTSRIAGCYAVNRFSGEDIRFQKRKLRFDKG